MHVINVAANVNTVAKIYGLASQLNGVIWTCGLYGAYMCHFLNIERSTLRLNSDKRVKSSFGGIKSFCSLLAPAYWDRIDSNNWYFQEILLEARFSKRGRCTKKHTADCMRTANINKI